MPRSILLLIALAPTLAAGAAEQRQPFYEPLLPEETIAVLSAADVNSMLDAAGSSPLGRLSAAGAEVGGTLGAYLQRARTVLALLTSLPKEQFGPLLDGGCAVALLRSDPRSSGQNAAAGGRIPALLLLDTSRLSPEARKSIEQTLTGALGLLLADRAAPRSSAGVEPLGDHVYQIKLGGGAEELAIAFTDSAVVAGFKADVVNRPAGGTLAKNECYQTVARRVGLGSDLGGFVDIRSLIDELDQRRPNTGRQESLKRLGAGSFASLGMRTTLGKGGVVDRFFIATRERTSWVRHLPTAQVKLQAATFVPADYDLCLAVDAGPGEKWWDAIRATIGEIKGADALQHFDDQHDAFEAPFGISLRDDILSSIDGEMFFAADTDRLSEIAGDGVDAAKVPYLMGFKVKQPETLAKALDRVFESDVMWDQMGVERRDLNAGEIRIVQLASLYEPRLKPGYAFVDGYFLFSPRCEAVKQAIEARQTGRNLAADAGFTRLRKTLPEAANAELFARTAILYRELFKAYRAGIPEQMLPAADKLGPEIEALPETMASVSLLEDGISATVNSPVGTALAASSIRLFRNAAQRIRLDRTREVLNSVAAALEKYRQAKGSYPARIEELIPDFLEEIPADPYAPWGLPVRYALSHGRDGLPDGYVLASCGPDGREDFDLRLFDAATWQQRQESEDEATVAELRAAIYQFRKDVYADERGIADEGDILLVGFAKPEKGGVQ